MLTLEEYIKDARDEYGWKIVESEVLNLLKIDDDLFTYNTQLGMIFDEFNRLSAMDGDLFTYEVEVLKPTYAPIAMIFIDIILVRLIDVTVEQWLDLKYDNHETMDENIKKRVIATWLIRSYKWQFEDYIEIKKQRDTYAREVDMEYNPSNMVFAKWLASRFYKHSEMDWTRRMRYRSIGCEFKNEWMGEWNKGIPWVFEEPWPENRVPHQVTGHICKPFHFKNVNAKWPTYNWKDEGFCNGGELLGVIQESWGDATQGVKNFYAWLKECFGNFHELDYELMVKLDKYWWATNDNEISPFANWRNHIRKTYMNTNISANYNPYHDVNRIFGRNGRASNNGDIQDKKEPKDDHGMKDFENDKVGNDTSYYSNEEEEQYKEERCEFLGNPHQEPPTCKIEKFEVIKYSFGPAEKFVAIRECGMVRDKGGIKKLKEA
ncbi:hypothetical protein Tco_1557063 [Tanacetum coccineum]